MTAYARAEALDDDQERALNALLGMQRQSWEQGVLGHALLDLGRADLLRVLARDAVIRQTTTGKLADVDDASTVNCAANGEAVLWAAEVDDDPALRAAFELQMDWILHHAPRAADGTLFHLEGTREVWADSVYMVVPLLVLTGDVEEASRQLAGHRERLYDESVGLYAARWSEDDQRLTLPAHWGTGSGWVVAGIARALRHLGGRAESADVAFRETAAAHARAVIDACLALRRPNGLFGDVVDDPASFDETNLAQMLAYGMRLGVADGWLPTVYGDPAGSLVATARRQLDPTGFVTPVCGAPRFDRAGISAEAQAFFLLATAAPSTRRITQEL